MKVSFKIPSFKVWGQSYGHDTMQASYMKRAMCRIAVFLTSIFLLAGPTSASAQDDNKNNEINGKVPEAPTECLLPGSPGPEYFDLGNGDMLLVEPGNRAVGTRSPVHTHPDSGATCVLRGEMTLILEGDKNKTFRGDISKGHVECYPMPAPDDNDDNKMSAVNTGSVSALIIDIFPVPKGIEPAKFMPMCVLQNKGLPSSPRCYEIGAGC
jgi:hypothetical protein